MNKTRKVKNALTNPKKVCMKSLNNKIIMEKVIKEQKLNVNIKNLKKNKTFVKTFVKTCVSELNKLKPLLKLMAKTRKN